LKYEMIYFASRPQAGCSILIVLDGKTLRGTIPAGQTQGLGRFPEL
jgi:hypothetical protein